MMIKPSLSPSNVNLRQPEVIPLATPASPRYGEQRLQGWGRLPQDPIWSGLRRVPRTNTSQRGANSRWLLCLDLPESMRLRQGSGNLTTKFAPRLQQSRGLLFRCSSISSTFCWQWLTDTFTKISMWEDIVTQEDKAYFASIALSYFLQLERRKGLRGSAEEELHSIPE